MQPIDWILIGFAGGIVAATAICWRQLEKFQRLERRRWQRPPLVTEQQIAAHQKAKPLWPLR